MAARTKRQHVTCRPLRSLKAKTMLASLRLGTLTQAENKSSIPFCCRVGFLLLHALHCIVSCDGSCRGCSQVWEVFHQGS